ncbi:hypothetical protein RFI_04062 [Reticulomyxa filosa]|uniref:Kelch motif family protein n=1 Tax=Reticulomyxa filosa TaxID=46433 RepID=X6P3C8_RETFI|nr:hypothetical protein RFI_04062 [Reticulomyxa filosa]|eukprot:ETO33045.1 hypothetical protein RFI_04062 [Reticulomyxa filosa]
MFSSDSDKEVDAKADDIIPFEALDFLPNTFLHCQCVFHNHEIIMCGGIFSRKCYVYHTFKKQYKQLDSYPKGITTEGHCVVKRVNSKNPNEVTLFSFGGQRDGDYKFTFVMKYRSVWDDVEGEGHGTEDSKTNTYNKWMPLINDKNELVFIGRGDDDYCGARGVIGGSDNNLLFITYFPTNIDVFNLNTLQYVCHAVLPDEITSSLGQHCFVIKTENGERKNNEMLLFLEKTGLSIKYDEDNNTFEFHELRVCSTMRALRNYAYVCIDDCILFFGGNDENKIHKYAMKDGKWTKFKYVIPNPLSDITAIVNEDDMYVHLIGGRDKTGFLMPRHTKRAKMDE